ncbi:armadillo-type protein [Dichotomocladium elegans]|nr:armadillo-type protein [Dichotomocladium elegans]
MKLWPKILSQLNAPEPEIRKGVAWVCGTAVQNNPEAQAAFLANNGMEPLLKLLKEEKDKVVKAKAIYAVSGILKHCTAAIQLFLAAGGLEVLCDTVKTSDDVAAVRKVVFMFNSLMIDSPEIAPALLKNGILDSLDRVLQKYSADEDACEKALRTLHTVKMQTKCPLSGDLKKHCEGAGNAFGRDNLNLSKEEWEDILA